MIRFLRAACLRDSFEPADGFVLPGLRASASALARSYPPAHQKLTNNEALGLQVLRLTDTRHPRE